MKKYMEELFITLEDITIRVRDKFILPHTTWKIRSGEHWAILGPNGAGKSSLVKVLAGEVPYVHGSIVYHFSQRPHEIIGYVSSELQEYLIAMEEYQDMSRYFARTLGDIKRAKDVILDGDHGGSERHQEFGRIADMLRIRYLLDRGIRHLSSGEMRKVVIARALVKYPKLLILDEPFAGIDEESRVQISQSLHEFMGAGLQVVQVTHREQEIFPLVSHILCIKDGKVLLQGKREDVLTTETIDRLYDVKKSNIRPWTKKIQPDVTKSTSSRQKVLIEMKNVTVKYGDMPVLNNLNWRVRRGENWAVVGPNGSGKTTLLNLITGDNPQVYANEIYLFGKRRGSGESVWDIKSRIGALSSEFQTAYRRAITAFDVVASGIFDSIGLYRKLDSEHTQKVEQWLDFFAISHIATKVFTQLSFGERRTVLLARSMVKSPELLVLDEPCLGLDREYRKLFMNMIASIGRDTNTNLLYATHYIHELPPCFDLFLKLEKAEPDDSAFLQRVEN